MPDMLVRLYDLPPMQPYLDQQASHQVVIRRGLPPEKHVISKWIGEHFNAGWISECEIAFTHTPPAVFIAHQDNTLLGFACYDATAKAFFGPTGVSELARGKGTGTALLLACLHDMYTQGYGYGIIGGAGPVDFYAKTVGATIIEGSVPGIYRGLLRD